MIYNNMSLGDLDVESKWFFIDEESIVIGDKVQVL
jgi:hypothetical protein